MNGLASLTRAPDELTPPAVPSIDVLDHAPASRPRGGRRQRAVYHGAFVLDSDGRSVGVVNDNR